MMFRKNISCSTVESMMQRITLLIIICTLSIKYSFDEPTTPVELQENEFPIVSKMTSIDAYTLHKINTLIQEISNKKGLSDGEKLSRISEKFIGTPYQSNRLIGSDTLPEELVVDFRGVDCFTFLDYVVALQQSHSQCGFFKNIAKTRYIGGEISFYKRKHFFTDWASYDDKIADDITAKLSPCAITHIKQLNEKAKDKQYLPGIPVVHRSITFIPGTAVDKALVDSLKSGDLIGVYSPLAGLDVSHVGFFIMTDKGAIFRHASSSKENHCVVDSAFIPYVSKTPGVIILRLRTSIS